MNADELRSEKNISVVMPAYNSSETICEALDSVVAAVGSVIEKEPTDPTSPSRAVKDGLHGCTRMGEGIELIVVDDCSSDNTLAAATQWHEGHPFSAFSFQLSSLSTNSGPAAARNCGIEEAHGEWVAFLDSDDAWLPHRLEVQLELAKQHPDVVMWCGGTVGIGKSPRITQMDTDGGEERAVGRGAREGENGSSSLPHVQRPAFHVLRLTDLAIENPVATSTVLVKRSILAELGGFDTQFRGPEDYDLWLRIAAKGQVMKIDAPLSRYRFVDGSLSMDERRFLPEVLRVLDKAFGPGGVLEARQEQRRSACSSQYWSASWMAFCRGDRCCAIRLWVAAYWLNLRSAVRTHRRWWRLLIRYAVGKGEGRGGTADGRG